MIGLRGYQPSDLFWLNTWLIDDELVMRWTGRFVPIPLTEQQMLEFHQGSESVSALTIVYHQQPVGYLETHLKPDKTMHLARLLVGEEKMRGKGIMRKVLNNLIEHLFSNTPTKRITLNVFADNTTAYRCYLNAGFSEYKLVENYRETGRDMVAMHIYKPVPGMD